MPGNWNSSDTLLEPFQAVRSQKMKLRSFAAFQRDTIQRQHLKVPIDTFTNCGDQHKKGNIDSSTDASFTSHGSGQIFPIIATLLDFFDVFCCVKELRPTWHCSDGGVSAADRSERAPSRRMHPSAENFKSAMHAWFKTRTFQIYYNLYGAEEQLGTALVEPAPRI